MLILLAKIALVVALLALFVLVVGPIVIPKIGIFLSWVLNFLAVFVLHFVTDALKFPIFKV